MEAMFGGAKHDDLHEFMHEKLDEYLEGKLTKSIGSQGIQADHMRMTVIYLLVTGQSLIKECKPGQPSQERQEITKWVYAQLVEKQGFQGGPVFGPDCPSVMRNSLAHWYTGLSVLVMSGDY